MGATRDTDALGSSVPATISRFRDLATLGVAVALFVPISELVDTSSHHAALADRSVIHPVTSRKSGPRRRETKRGFAPVENANWL